MKQCAYLVACKATSIESRGEFTRWLKERGAVHVLGDVWFLTSHYLHAGDLQVEIEKFKDFDGQFLAVKLNQATDCCRKNLTDEANSWIQQNLGSSVGS